jgi:hypothetical protein
MPKKRRRRSRQDERLTRTVEISSFSARVSLHVEEPKDADPQLEVRPWLELRGTMNESVRDVRDIVFSVYPKERTSVGTARPASVRPSSRFGHT